MEDNTDNLAKVIDDSSTKKDAETSSQTDAVDNNIQSTAQKEENTVAETVQEEVYQLKYLIENCKALGYKKEIVAGAFLNYEKTEMTKTEFEATIKKFLGKKVN